MEKMMMKPQYSSTPTSNELQLRMPHKDSHKISKSTTSKPKVRIIHVFAPEIIKTDAANFRELVQILTGKPAPPPEAVSIAGRKKTIRRSTCSTSSSPTPSKKMLELENDGRDERVIMEEMQDYMWRSSSLPSGDLQSDKINDLLDGFSDVEELSTGFPSLYSSSTSSSIPIGDLLGDIYMHDIY